MYPIFSQKEIKEKLLNFLPKEIPNYAEKIKAIQQFQKAILSSKIKTTKEESLQADFLNLFFGQILGYDYQNPQNWSLEKELKSKTDQTKVDGALGYFSVIDNINDETENKETENNKSANNSTQKADVRAIIELKSANYNLDKNQYRKDFKGSAVAQAFSYVSKQGGNCKWVLVSNFLEIRLYASNDQSRYEQFDILELDQDQNFRWFYFLLSKERLFKKNEISPTLHLYQNKLEKEENITKEYYAHYSELRVHFLQHLIENNPNKNPFDLLEYTQLVIDRLVFVCFVKDLELVSIFILDKLQKSIKELYDRKQEKFWHELLDFFDALDKGFNGRVPAFNGGLFKEKEELKNLQVKNNAINNLFQLTKYDYQSDLNVNILGHIFEQSLSDIEALKEQIAQKGNVSLDEKQLSLRKTNGIFYTPEYITQYMVKESVGVWLEERKEEILEKYNYSTEQKQFWIDYKSILENVKVLDPSCGSGAFLVQVFDFLWAEWQIVIREIEKVDTITAKNDTNLSKITNSLDLTVSSEQFSEDKIKKHIVSNNLFGVDLNFESVEITRLALWLKTASKKETLADLSPTIKRGNSLISDKTISDFGFDWKTEFLHGFDVIVGNPPYVDIRMIKTQEKDYFNIHFRQKNNFDLYTLFIERGLELINKNGVLSFIVPRPLISNSTFSAIRSMMFENEIKEINLLKEKVFEDAEVESVIFLLKKAIPKSTFKGKIGLESFETLHLENYKNGMSLILQPKEIIEIFERFENIQNNTFTELENIVEIARGLELGKSTLEKVQSSKQEKVGIFAGNAIGKYSFDKDFIFYVEEKEIKPYLKTLSSEYTNYPRLLMRRVAKFPIATLLSEGEPFINNLNTVYNLILKEEQKTNFDKLFLLAILNSTFLRFYCEKKLSSDEKLFPYLRIEQIKSFPIPIISIEKQEIINQKVNEVLEFQKELDNQNRSFIKILKTDFQINKISKKLKNWSDLEYSDFINEVDKKNILTFQDKKKWLTIFEEEQKQFLSMERKKYNLDKEIDNFVFELYQINETEKQIIFDSLD